MRRTIKNMLYSLEYSNVSEASDGDDAISELDNFKDIPNRMYNYVVLDWNMPRVHGIDVLKHIRRDALLRETPVMMVTAENWSSEIMEAAEEQVDGYIIKPFIAKTLQAKIERIMENKRNPSEVEKIYREGVSLIFEDKLDEAKAKFEEVLKLKPNLARAFRQIGIIETKKNNYKDAVENFQKAMQNNKQYTSAYTNIAELFIKIDKKDEAIKVLQEAAQINPRNHERLVMLGKLFVEKGRHEEIIDLYKKVNSMGLSIRKSDLDVVMGSAYLGAEQHEKAVDFFKSAMKLDKREDENELKEEIKGFIDKSDNSDSDKDSLKAQVMGVSG